jgi:hypothetical protein
MDDAIVWYIDIISLVPVRRVLPMIEINLLTNAHTGFGSEDLDSEVTFE